MMAGSMPPSMVAGGAAQETYDGVRIGPPPDLASLLLHNRIVYLGMPMVSAVTELIVAELLYLNYESPSKPVTLYINSPGTVNAQGQAVGFETEAFAIADCMKYIKPPVQTICVGKRSAPRPCSSPRARRASASACRTRRSCSTSPGLKRGARRRTSPFGRRRSWPIERCRASY